MTREEMQARAVELRGEGVIYDEIAMYLGVSRTTILRWTNVNYAEHSRSTALTWKQRNRERNRARDRQYGQDTKTPCQWCGGPCHAEEACRECRHAWAVVRRTLVEGMWADGWALKEMSVALGCDAASRIGPWRERDGFDLPYRYSGTKRQRVAA